MQVKGHIAKMAVCIEDSDPRISALARLFFEELSHKVTKVPPRAAPAQLQSSPAPQQDPWRGPSTVMVVPTPIPHLQHLPLPCRWSLRLASL